MEALDLWMFVTLMGEWHWAVGEEYLVMMVKNFDQPKRARYFVAQHFIGHRLAQHNHPG